MSSCNATITGVLSENWKDLCDRYTPNVKHTEGDQLACNPADEVIIGVVRGHERVCCCQPTLLIGSSTTLALTALLSP